MKRGCWDEVERARGRLGGRTGAGAARGIGRATAAVEEVEVEVEALLLARAEVVVVVVAGRLGRVGIARGAGIGIDKFPSLPNLLTSGGASYIALLSTFFPAVYPPINPSNASLDVVFSNSFLFVPPPPPPLPPSKNPGATSFELLNLINPLFVIPPGSEVVRTRGEGRVTDLIIGCKAWATRYSIRKSVERSFSS